MNRFVFAASLGAVGTAILLASTGSAAASASPNAAVEIAARGMTLTGSSGGSEARQSAPVAASVELPDAARVTIARAADLTGKPVYFSRSAGSGSAGQVSFSTRRMPEGAVFSIALRPLRPVLPAMPLAIGTFSGNLPSSMPVSARALTSGFGLRQHPILGTLRVHSGVDLAASFGSPIVATSDGMVNVADWAGGYGLLVALDHGGGLQTRYAHMSRLNVVPGQQVRKGDVIGFVGSTGRSTGPHLHYEIRVNGQAVNPVGHLHGR